MPTKSEIITSAVDAGLGHDQQLRQLFHSWQKNGLIGHASMRTATHEGVFHPIQQAFFLAFLGARKGPIKKPLPMLALNIVGYWLQGTEGIELRQVKLAYRTCMVYAIDNSVPHDAQSERVRHVKDFAKQVTAEGVKRPVREKFTSTLNRAVNYAPDAVIEKKGFIAAWMAATSPSDEQSDEAQANQRAGAEGAHFYVVLLVLAGECLDVLTSDVDNIDQLWDWARKFTTFEWIANAQMRAELQATPGIGYLEQVDEDLLKVFFNSGPERLAIAFGFSILRMRGEGHWEEAWAEPPVVSHLLKPLQHQQRQGFS